MENSWRRTVERSRGPPCGDTQAAAAAAAIAAEAATAAILIYILVYDTRESKLKVPNWKNHFKVHANCSINSAEENRI